MIAVKKDLAAVPPSLVYPADGQLSETTDLRRQQLIAAGCYTDTKVYSSRYKQNDTKKKIKSLYHKKCCYCEQKVEAGHIEHYRPKSLYWWLTYSWDNLLWICPTCNSHKKDHFETSGPKAVFSLQDMPAIHKLREVYNASEQPSLLNPECDDLESMWVFDRLGGIRSEEYRGQYSIELLQLNREDLRDDRKKLMDDFEEDLLDVWGRHEKNEGLLLSELGALVEKFAKKYKKPDEPFCAFGRYASIALINDLIMEIYN